MRWRACQIALQAIVMTAALSPMAHAQAAASGSNTGAVTFTGGLDLPTVYVFRGIVQEVDPNLTLFPYGDIGIRLASGDGAVKHVGVNVGVWNSLQTGSSGSKGYTEKLHYEEDFYTALTLGFSKGITTTGTYTAYSSPNLMFNTVHELGVKVAQASRINPYGIIAFELGTDGRDGGEKKGTYLELGVGPMFPLGKTATLTIPVKLGVSLSNYYELDGVDHTFGFFDVGGLLTLPMTFVPPQYGKWNIHGGVDVLTLGDTTREFNQGDKNKVVGLIGVGLTY